MSNTKKGGLFLWGWVYIFNFTKYLLHEVRGTENKPSNRTPLSAPARRGVDVLLAARQEFAQAAVFYQ